MRLNAVSAGDAPAPPLVLLHGLFGQAGNFGRLQRALARTHRVIALDLRNHGASPHASSMTYPEMAGDVLDTLAALGALPAALLGHSMGGKVAMATALLAPEAVARLLVADIAPRPYRGLTRAAAAAALAKFVPDPGVQSFLLQNLRFGETPSWQIGLAEITAALPDIEAWPDIESWPHRAARYAGPSLFVAGERSDYIAAADRPAIRALFPEARFVTLKQAGHWLHADNPDGFAAVVTAFMARGTPPQGAAAR
jgi:esterase